MTEYVDLSNYKDLRLVAFTNSPLDLYLVHSLDGESKGICDRYKLVAGSWRSEKFESKMKYVAIEVINCSDVANTNLVVTVTGQLRASTFTCDAQSRRFSTVELPHPEKIESRHVDFKEPEEEPKKSKSPFRKFVFKKTTPHGVPPQNDQLPNLILEGAFLIGDKKNRTRCLPRGNPHEVLMIGADGFPCFVPLHEMIQIYLFQREKADVSELDKTDVEVTSIPTGWTDN